MLTSDDALQNSNSPLRGKRGWTDLHPLEQLKRVEAKLSQMATKQALGITLTASEQNLAAEMARIQLLKPTEKTHLHGDGRVSYEKTLDAQPIIDGVREQSELITRTHRNASGALYLGSIDPYTAQNWAKECGRAVGTKEFAKYAKKKLMDPDFKHFRAERNKF